MPREGQQDSEASMAPSQEEESPTCGIHISLPTQWAAHYPSLLQYPTSQTGTTRWVKGQITGIVPNRGFLLNQMPQEELFLIPPSPSGGHTTVLSMLPETHHHSQSPAWGIPLPWELSPPHLVPLCWAAGELLQNSLLGLRCPHDTPKAWKNTFWSGEWCSKAFVRPVFCAVGGNQLSFP